MDKDIEIYFDFVFVVYIKFQKWASTPEAELQHLVTEIEKVQSTINSALIVNSVQLSKCVSDLSVPSDVSQERIDYLYSRFIQPSVGSVRASLLSKYKTVLDALVNCVNSFDKLLREPLLKHLQPSVQLMEEFDDNAQDACSTYMKILPNATEVLFNSPEDIHAWKNEKFERKFAFMPESHVVTLIRCDVLELVELLTASSSLTGERLW